MRTGIYGGTFNPIHLGHLHILREFHSRLKLDRIILMPAAKPPHKPDKELAGGKDRYEMCLIAAKELDFPVEVSGLELERGKKSYTADTLKELKQLYPNEDFFLIMGEDMFLTVEKWYKPEIIFELATVCAAPRNPMGIELLENHGNKLKKSFPKFRYVIEDIPFLDISSTAVRRGGAGLVPRAVEEYIRQHSLYAFREPKKTEGE